MLAEPLAVTLLVIDAFEKLGVSYMIGGSLASALYGTARSTLDTDFVADINADQVALLVKMLENEFFIEESMIMDSIRTRRSFNVIHLATLFKVDVFLPKQRRFDQIQLQRRQNQVISIDPERKAYFATAEDIILAKLEWYRLGNEISDRQWRDILGVLKVQAGRLDMDYLHKWAAELNVADLLQRALSESQ